MTESCRRRYHATPEQHAKDIASQRRSRLRKKDWMDGVKSFLGCFVCGEEKPWRLVWHHLDPDGRRRAAARSPSEGIRVGDGSRATIPQLLEEMRHCVLLCHNCHADVHNDQSRGL